MRTIMPVAALAALLGGPAMAQPATQPIRPAPATAAPAGTDRITHATTVADLAALCAPRTDGVQRLEAIAYCQGYMTSAGHAYASLMPSPGPRRPLVCLASPGPTVAEAGIAFAAWAAQNPQWATEPAIDGLLRFAQGAYPCAPTAAAATRAVR